MAGMSQAPKKLRIGELLKQKGLIDERQLQHALEEQRSSGRKLGRTLIDLGYVPEDALLQLLSEQLGMPCIELRHFPIDTAQCHRLPETYARRFRALLLKEEGGRFLVGMADPMDILAFDEISRILGGPISGAVVRESELLSMLDIIYRRTDEIASIAEELSEELGAELQDIDLIEAEDTADAPVVRLLQSMFEDAVQVGASDIHIEPDERELRIRQRVDGVLYEQVMPEKRIASALVLRLKLMAGLDISEKRLPQDGRFNVKVKGHTVDVRMATCPTQHGESVVMRLLDQSAGAINLDQVGMPERMLETFRMAFQRPHGLVLVTGPTGSGKTTTLYGALRELNTPRKKIITVEDPVEYQLPRITQVQVHERIGLSFATVLRSALRQDPDVLLVGEIRDQQTAEIALRASMTGHLVLSTLHTNDAVSSAMRLLDIGVEGYLVAATLRAIVAQRLVRRVCDACATPYTPSEAEVHWLGQLFGEGAARHEGYQRGAGCTQCNHTGYHGRIGVFEMLGITHAMADALRRGDTSGFEAAAQAAPGYRPLTHCALDDAKQGITSVEEVLRLSELVSLD